MTENEHEPDAPVDAAPVPRKRRRWKLWLITIFVIAPVTIVVLWTLVAVNWTYSQGYRAGYVQKFSKKGWLCKTWEGELAMVTVPGTLQERWDFTVRSDSVARAIQAAMGNHVQVSYDQHVGVPTGCFGEIEYYVTGVAVIKP